MTNYQKYCMAFLGLSPIAAFAQADPVIAAINDVGTKVVTYTAPLLAVAVLGAVITLGIKFIKKAPRAV